MNLTGQDVYQKVKRKGKSNTPTKAQRERWEQLRALGCVICGQHAHIHHCHTGAGGRKDHDKVIPLCHFHHQGAEGIHTLSRRVWEAKYGTEAEHLSALSERLPPGIG